MGSGNWIVDNLNSALGTWNGKLAEIWTLLSTGPEEFKGGGVWSVIVGINDGLKAIGYALLVIFFVMGVVKTCGSFTELRKPEQVLACVIFSAFASAPPALSDPSLAAATIVWNYVGEILFNMLVLVGAIKMSDRLIRELMGLG